MEPGLSSGAGKSRAANSSLETQIRKFGKYQLIAHLASGGMAEIFLARQRGIGGFEKLLVIKKILPHLAKEEVFVQMFLDEARIAAQLNHQNVVQIYDLGCEESQYFIAMEYLEGESLSALMRKSRKVGRPIPPYLAAGITMQVCDGLHHAHSMETPDGQPLNVVHRDVNPQNIFVLYSGLVKVVDFGIAKAAKRFSQTSTGMLKGKYAYMSPEQVMGLALDSRSDVYSMGVVLWELLTGRRLFRSTSELEILKTIAEQEPPPPSSLLPSIPKELEDICMRALKRSRNLRYQSAGEMRMELSFLLKAKKEPSDTVAIGEFSQALFYDQMNEKRRLIKHAQALGADLDDSLFGELQKEGSTTDSAVANLSSWNLEPPKNETESADFGQRPGLVSIDPPRKMNWPFVVVSTFVLVGGGFLAFWLLKDPLSESIRPVEPMPVGPALRVNQVPEQMTPPVVQEKTQDFQASNTIESEPDEPELEAIEIKKPKKAKATRPRTKLETRRGQVASVKRMARKRAPGRLRLATSPWTTVYLRQRKLGVTPLVDLELPSGRHVLRAINPDKDIEKRIIVVIKPGETTVKSVRF